MHAKARPEDVDLVNRAFQMTKQASANAAK
jgi:hypothetical protein